jgi:hypothetical protein
MMKSNQAIRRPVGITIIAFIFCAIAIYLWIVAAILLLSPGTISMMAGRHFMYGLELAGPYMALLIGAGYALVAWGLFRLHNWARWAVIVVLVLGVATLVPAISMAELGVPVLRYGLQIALRVAIGWYITQAPAVLDAFSAKS